MSHLSPPHTTEPGFAETIGLASYCQWDNRNSSRSDPVQDILLALGHVDELVSITFGRAAWCAFLAHPETIRAAGYGRLLPTRKWFGNAVVIGSPSLIVVDDTPEHQAKVVVRGMRGSVTLTGVVGS